MKIFIVVGQSYYDTSSYTVSSYNYTISKHSTLSKAKKERLRRYFYCSNWLEILEYDTIVNADEIAELDANANFRKEENKMKKSILITLPAEKIMDIFNGNITILIQKIKPKCELPIDVYIYCAKDTYEMLASSGALNRKVIAKFTLNTVEELSLSEGSMPYDYWPYDYWLSGYQEDSDEVVKDMGMTFIEFVNYHVRDTRTTKKIPYLVSYAWHINDLVIFDKPKELNQFYSYQSVEHDYGGIGRRNKPLTKAPRNWKYIYVKGE